MKQNRFLVGITGNIGSGKSTVCSLIEKYGYPVISCDAKTEEAYKIAKEKLMSVFGEDIYDNDVVNRKALSKIVFNDLDKRQALNAIMHPIILNLIMNEADKYNGIVFVEVPLLFEIGFQPLFKEIWLIMSEKNEVISRIEKRDKITNEDAQKRIMAQIPDEKKVDDSHIIIHNNGSIDELSTIVAVEIEKLRERANS